MRPTARGLGRGNLEKKTDSFARGDMDIVLASFAMHSDGKIPDVQVEKVETWLCQRSKFDERVLRALPGREAMRTATEGGRRLVGGATRARSTSRPESLWASATQLRLSVGD